ncbi:hypothetical protein LDO26_01265 [Luteimonas sp. BDR2-5]|uniref:hypothetical protein n=1 Tax=Proluteimonas luteida TaxID=2878685 RepID=UPI001E58CE09|nr:hypothetical protein [Luteimonas sp. BDR2-5]MCD9026846.1 hypothetical protein [Luteimonas sp. BDR2-5]
MDRLDPRRLVWTVNRWFLLRGAVAWIVAVGAATLLLVLLLLAASLRQYNVLKSQLESPGIQVNEVGEQDSPAAPLPFPSYGQRFDVTARALEAFRIEESLAGKITFAYDSSEDARLVRQTATMNIDSQWHEVGALLDRAQMAIPTAYISRLHIAREAEHDALIEAEIKFTLVYRDRAEDVVQ